jgi:hypothetical protein
MIRGYLLASICKVEAARPSVLQHHVVRSRVTWLSGFRRGILPIYSGYMTEILITKRFIDPVSHQPLKKALHSHIIRKFGTDISVVVAAICCQFEELHLCTTKKTLCAVRCFYHLTNTIEGETALRGTIPASWPISLTDTLVVVCKDSHGLFVVICYQ